MQSPLYGGALAHPIVAARSPHPLHDSNRDAEDKDASAATDRHIVEETPATLGKSSKKKETSV